MGRKSTFTQKLADEICARISVGETLRSICRDEHMPDWQRVYEWIHENEEFEGAIARARILGHTAIAEETVDIIDTPPERGPDGRVDSGYVQWQKNRAYQRMQLLAKWSPKIYGDKVAVGGADDLPAIGITKIERVIIDK